MLLFLFVSESKSTISDKACTQLDIHSAVASAIPDVAMVGQSSSEVNLPVYASWTSPTFSYVDGTYASSAVGAYDQLGYETAGAPTTTATATPATNYVEFMPCNMQQRLVCGCGGLIQYHSTGGAVFNALPYDAVQQRALSDLSGMLSATFMKKELVLCILFSIADMHRRSSSVAVVSPCRSIVLQNCKEQDY